MATVITTLQPWVLVCDGCATLLGRCRPVSHHRLNRIRPRYVCPCGSRATWQAAGLEQHLAAA